MKSTQEKVKRLFHDVYDSYLPEATALDEEVHSVIKPIIKKWLADGYSSVDVEMVTSNAVSMICIFERAYTAVHKRKQETGADDA